MIFMLSCLFWFAVRLYESRWYNPQKWLSEGPFSSKLGGIEKFQRFCFFLNGTKGSQLAHLLQKDN